MCSIAIKIPDEVLYDTKMTKDEANAFAKKATALMLYLKNHISIGYCAQIAGMSEEDFIKYLGNNNISIFSFDDEAEFIEEMNNAASDVYKRQAVFDEVTAKKDSACLQIKQNLDWITVETITNIEDRKMYKAKLHAGEVDVMILAQADPKADLVIIDDNAAKKTAKYLGLTVTGTLGVLIKAKQSGIISSVKNAITKIQSNGFYINENIIKLALKQAGEL